MSATDWSDCPEVPPRPRKPEAGDIWRHWRGATYEVLLLANECGGDDPERWPVMVVYRNPRLDQVWTRRLDEWHRSFTLQTPAEEVKR